MAGYSDTRQMIIDTLMGRPAGTEIQPEDHQAFALQITDYVRSVELVAGNATPIGFADASTVPVQPDNGQAVYLSQVGRGTTVVFTNFIDQNGNAISVTSDSSSVTFVTLLWNGQYWTKQETRISLENTVQENDIADGAVQTANIKDYNVIGKKISSGAITNDKIRAGAVSIDKLNADLQPKVSDNVKYVEQNLTKEQQLQARKNIELPDYETFDDLRKLSTLTAKRLLYVGPNGVYPGFPISVNSSIEEIDFQGKKIYFSALDAEQIAFKGHPNCKLKNLSCALTKADYTKDANVCISKFGYVENVTVDCLVYSSEVGKEVNKTVGFLSCDHLYNCKVIGGGVLGKSGFTKGYSYCNYLNLCRYKISSELVGAKGFDHCNFISQCYVNRQSEEIMGLGTNSNVESLIWILANGSFETFSDVDHITVGGYDTTNMFKTIGSNGGTGKTKLYAKPDDKSGMSTVLLDTTPVNWAVARRTSKGTLKAKDAVEEDDTVTKKQLDTLKTEVTQHLTEDEVANLWDTTK